jgi:CheY-like chemotaxis protein/HPt (histidine-containing phosphotransfer) domain-containing protein
MDENIFYDEFMNKLQCMENALLDVPSGTYDIDEIFRSVHTIKGTADLLGMTDVVNITHKAENLLEDIRSGKLILDKKLSLQFLELKKFIALMVENLLSGIDEDEMVKTLTEHFEKELFNPKHEDIEQKKTILIVDDSIVIRERSKLIAQENDYKVITATNGIQALEKIYNNKIDLIFCDVSVKEIGGLEMIYKIKRDITYNTIPVVMLLSTKTEEHITMAKNIDAKAWLQKPFDKKRFLMVLDKILS